MNPTSAVFKEYYCTCKVCCKKHGIEHIEFFNNGSVAYREPPILPLGYTFPKYTYDYKRVKAKFDEVIENTTVYTYFEEQKETVNKSLCKYSIIGVPTQFDPYPPGNIFEYTSSEHDTEEEAKTDCMIQVLQAQFLLCVHEFRTDKKAINFKYTYNKNGTEEDKKLFHKNQKEFYTKRIKEQVSLFYKYYPKAEDHLPRLKEYLKFDKFEPKNAYLYLVADQNKFLHWKITFNPLDIKHEGMLASSIDNKILLNPFFNALERNKDGYQQCRFFTKNNKDEVNNLIQQINPEMKKFKNKLDSDLIHFCNTEETRLSELVEDSMFKIYHFMKQVYGQHEV